MMSFEKWIRARRQAPRARTPRAACMRAGLGEPLHPWYFFVYPGRVSVRIQAFTHSKALVVQARVGEKRIDCDCLEEAERVAYEVLCQRESNPNDKGEAIVYEWLIYSLLTGCQISVSQPASRQTRAAALMACRAGMTAAGVPVSAIVYKRYPTGVLELVNRVTMSGDEPAG